jgi:hypothetical protein
MKRGAILRTQVSVPERLIGFLRGVADAIEDGHISTTVESDDLLQCTWAYGGLIDKEHGLYGFRYFPDDESDVTWDIELTREEILMIGRMQSRHMVLWACPAINCGCLYPRETFYCWRCREWHDSSQEEQELSHQPRTPDRATGSE